MKKNHTKKDPFWIQIVLILFAGALVSIVSLYAIKEFRAERHTVTFAYQDGTIIETQKVKEGSGVCPPEFTCDGVFQGWNGRINYVEADIEVHPLIYSIREENLFFFNSLYVREGRKFTLNIWVGGKVCISSGTISISYDPNVLKFVKSSDVVDCNITEETKGEIKIHFNHEAGISEKMILAQLTFKALKKDAYCTELSLSAENVKGVVDGREVPTNYATLNNKIYFLQEVDW